MSPKDFSMDQQEIEGLPARIEEFEGQSVSLYEVDGEIYLAGEDLGKILGMSDPRNGVRKIYERHKSELEIHSCAVKLTAQGDQRRRVRLYNEVGSYLIAMFAQTPKAREVRVWLAALPKRIRTVTQNSWQRTLQDAHFNGFARALKMFLDLHAGKVDVAKVLSVIEYRLLGLSAASVAKLLGVAKCTVHAYERQLREHGLDLPRLKGSSRADAVSLSLTLARAAKDRAERGYAPALQRVK